MRDLAEAVDERGIERTLLAGSDTFAEKPLLCLTSSTEGFLISTMLDIAEGYFYSWTGSVALN